MYSNTAPVAQAVSHTLLEVAERPGKPFAGTEVARCSHRELPECRLETWWDKATRGT
jgi:hypothetical protein